MARTTKMQLIELLVMKDDITRVIEYLGKRGNFQFQRGFTPHSPDQPNAAKDMFDALQSACVYLHIPEPETFIPGTSIPTDAEYKDAEHLLMVSDAIRQKEIDLEEQHKKAAGSYAEALSFSNLQVPYAELEHLSFLSIRIGKIDSKALVELAARVGERAVFIALGDDGTRVMAVSSRKGRFSLDTELKKAGFVDIEIAKDFMGIPEELLENLKKRTEEIQAAITSVNERRANFAETHTLVFQRLLSSFSLAMQVLMVRNSLESTQSVYRIIGWTPEAVAAVTMKEIDDLTEGRIAIRLYQPNEVPSVKNGTEQVPVKLTHGKFVGSFERMIFSYGAPLYGSIDPTPMVAVFFTVLFGVMFGDVGQGLVFLIIGILLARGIIKQFPAWNKFGPIFVGIGISSMTMGLLTGEFFANHHVLAPAGTALAGLFGAEYPVLHLMPQTDSIHKIFYFFLFTLSVGFIINSVGLIINIINNLASKNFGKALLGKTGLAGALFFWYAVVTVVRIVAFKIPLHTADIVVGCITLLGVFLAEPLERIMEGHRPVFENGIGSGLIQGAVEILEVLSSYVSNSVSFLRVGAFALAHAVLGYIIFTMTERIGGAGSIGGFLVTVAGNVIVIVLEGMIVAIQVIRLQYYEFFSKFFTKMGKEFEPFKFAYNRS
ncbi:MAG: V-type ATPase 116kDa subunit family protein [Treponemataceae bacterium]|nr:MAG: V-type ATPase 116kDa subunit family protein [Treponemataceae bacterium]